MKGGAVGSHLDLYEPLTGVRLSLRALARFPDQQLADDGAEGAILQQKRGSGIDGRITQRVWGGFTGDGAVIPENFLAHRAMGTVRERLFQRNGEFQVIANAGRQLTLDRERKGSRYDGVRM